VALGSVLGLIGVALFATAARTVLPVGEWYAVKSAAILALVMIVAAFRVSAHHPFDRFGTANLMTTVRAALVALAGGLIGEPAAAPVAAFAVGVTAIVVVLDGTDGWLARRGGISSAFGARFDMEVDALLIMALAILVWLHGKAAGWVLLSGLLRYAFVAAGWLAPWLERALARQQPEALGLARPGFAWHGGEAIELRIVEARRTSAGWNAGALELRAPDRVGAASALERWYRSSARDAIAASIERQAEAIGVEPKALAVRDQRTRWGSCSSRGTLSFSWRLILAPPAILDYVVAHEVAHLRELNHRPRFWRLVDTLVPDVDKSMRWLSENGTLLHRYAPRNRPLG